MRDDDFTFDNRVAQRYNLQRAHPLEVSRQIGEAIAAQIGHGEPLLEIGVGTGRIALPVVAGGCRVIGIDISPNMLEEVPPDRLQLVQADMHHLPFRTGSFAGVLAVHVLHLAQDWQRVLREAVRVLRSDGMFIVGEDWIDPESVTGRMRAELRSKALDLAPHMMPPAATVSREQVLRDLGGGETAVVVAAEWTEMVSPAERLAAVENRTDSESWVLPPHLFAPVLDHLRNYVSQSWSDLEVQQSVIHRFLLKVTRWDAG